MEQPDGQPPLDLAYGDRAVAVLRAADVVVKSPGVPVSSDLYRALLDGGCRFTSLMDLWLTENAHRTIGVTGTKGKSTTASAIGHVLEALGHTGTVLGNIGRNVLEESGSVAGVVVVEISSYQAQSLSVSPRVAVVTSLFPEHVPWHGSVERYFADKLRLVQHAPEDVVAPAADERLVAMIRDRIGPVTTLHLTGPDTVHADETGAVVWPGVGALAAADLPLRGRHNAGNLALALLAVEAYGLLTTVDDRARALESLRTFRPLAHRMEPIPSSDGRTWIDDSLATAPEAVVAALDACGNEDVALIVGGADRGLDMTPLVEHLRTRLRPTPVLLIGPTGERLARELGPDLAPHDVRAFPRLADAVAWAMSDRNPAATVLFSPGAPSFDEFADYEARSRALRALVAPPAPTAP